MYRIFMLIVFVAVGTIVAIPLRAIFDAWPNDYFSSYEMALLGLVPITFLIFVVFVGPARRVLQGGSPWKAKKKPWEKRRPEEDEE